MTITVNNANMYFTTNGANRLYISGSTGHLNIVNNSKLIFNDTTDDMRLQLYTGYGFGINSGTLRYNSGSDHRFYANSTTTMLINGSGQVCIGNVNPRARLDVYDGYMIVRGTNEGATCGIYISNPFTSDSALKTAIFAQGISSYSRSKLHFCLNNNADNSTSASIADAKMTIDTGGYVGIYNQYPQNYLHIGNVDVAGSDPMILLGKRKSDSSGFRTIHQYINNDFYFTMGDAGNVNNSIPRVEAFMMYYAAPYQTCILSSNGRCYSLQFVDVSDERTKTDIETIDNALWKVQQLRGVKYKNIQEGFPAMGLIAQEVEGICPEVVSQISEKDDKKGINYSGLVGLLVEAIKEQQQQIAEMKQQINYLLNK